MFDGIMSNPFFLLLLAILTFGLFMCLGEYIADRTGEKIWAWGGFSAGLIAAILVGIIVLSSGANILQIN